MILEGEQVQPQLLDPRREREHGVGATGIRRQGRPEPQVVAEVGHAEVPGCPPAGMSTGLNRSIVSGKVSAMARSQRRIGTPTAADATARS
jgi:hypothetical protein